MYKISYGHRDIAVEATPLCFASSKPEMEVASLYFDIGSKEYVLFYSAQSDFDYLSRTTDTNGLPVGSIGEVGLFYEARLPNFLAQLRSPPRDPVVLEPTLVVGTSPNSYANRLIPELGGICLGFDLGTGRPVCGTRTRVEMVPTAPFSPFHAE